MEGNLDIISVIPLFYISETEAPEGNVVSLNITELGEPVAVERKHIQASKTLGHITRVQFPTVQNAVNACRIAHCEDEGGSYMGSNLINSVSYTKCTTCSDIY